MKVLLSIVIVLSIFQTTKAQVYARNDYHEPVWLAVAYFLETPNFKGWVTKGWYKINPGERRKVLAYVPLNNSVYWYAQTEGAKRKFDGNTRLLADPVNAFEIRNANMTYVLKEHEGCKFLGFKKEEMGLRSLGLKYTIKID